MARNAEGENSQRGNAGSSTATDTRIRARAKPLLLICQCFGFITSVAPFLCIPVNVISATRSFKNGPHVFDGIFRCYAVVIAILVVVAETEWGFVMKFWKGILRIGILKRELQQKVSREQALRDLQELERHREELEALLIVQTD